ncbi:MAG: type II toxin-antitoxin system VapC family toxin [Sphingobium sp.]
MLVIDSSVAAKWVIGEVEPEPDAAAALALLSETLIAPDFMMAEFANVVWKKVRRGEIGAGQARDALVALPEMVSFLPTAPYVAHALDMGLALDHPVYDCIFLALAYEQHTVVVTADLRLLNRCADTPYSHLARDLMAAGKDFGTAS